MIYVCGFGNTFEIESIPGALLKGQNSFQKCQFNQYAEQLIGLSIFCTKQFKSEIMAI